MESPQDETLWPVWADTPAKKYLKKIGYYNEYIDVWFDPNNINDDIYGTWSGGYIRLPKGMKGSKLMSIKKSLSAEYKALERKNDPILEAKNTGATIGYDWMKKK
jgi:hypothetical protein